MDCILKAPKSSPHVEYDYGPRVNILEDGEGAPGKTYNLDCVTQQKFEESLTLTQLRDLQVMQRFLREKGVKKPDGSSYDTDYLPIFIPNNDDDAKNKTCKSVHKTEPTVATITTTTTSVWVPLKTNGDTCYMSVAMADLYWPPSNKMLAKEEKKASKQ